MAKGSSKKSAPITKREAAAAKVVGAAETRKEGPKAQKSPKSKPRARGSGKAAEPRLLSGGNPQISKAYGDAPVQVYIAAMSGGGPGWKRDVGHRLDAIIVRVVPNVRKAVKWNSPLYGAAGEEGTWFLGIHCFAKYIKVAFFRGASLRPLPPGESKQKDVRYLDIYEDGTLGRGGKGGVFDEVQFSDWVRQASKLPGERV